VPQTEAAPWVENLWLSRPPPKLGRAYLPGSPPPIAHSLQMRENCIACHVGPGAVEGIRTTHASRGNCRQCHVPDQFQGDYERTPAK
jgi:cytochrome c-type protein NapB